VAINAAVPLEASCPAIHFRGRLWRPIMHWHTTYKVEHSSAEHSEL